MKHGTRNTQMTQFAQVIFYIIYDHTIMHNIIYVKMSINQRKRQLL